MMRALFDSIADWYRTSVRPTLPERRAVVPGQQRGSLPGNLTRDLEPPNTTVFGAEVYDEVEVGYDEDGAIVLRSVSRGTAVVVRLSAEQAGYLHRGLGAVLASTKKATAPSVGSALVRLLKL